MAKNEKTIRQAYPATVVVDGESVPPGTAITLPESEANSIAAAFGIIDATAEHKRSAKSQGPDLSIQEKAVADARATYDAALAVVEAGGNGDAERKAAESALRTFEKAQVAASAARDKYKAAETALGAEGSGDNEVKAFEAAETALDKAEKDEAAALALRESAETAFAASGASAKDVKALEDAKKALDKAESALAKAKGQ